MRAYLVPALAFVAVAAATLTACTSTTSGTGSGGSRSVTTAAPATSPAPSSPGTATATTQASAAPSTHASTGGSAPAATRKVVIRPVDASGHPAAGFTVETESSTGPVTCGDASPVAVDPNIRLCSPSAAYAIACWRSTDPSWVLCLRDPLLHMLARLSLSGSFTPVPAVAHPSPERIVLPDDISCVIRDGGAWDELPSHPQWAGAYGCNMRMSIYGPANTDGIDRTHPLWTVHEVPDSALGVHGTGGPIAVRPVTVGYYVGTAS